MSLWDRPAVEPATRSSSAASIISASRANAPSLRSQPYSALHHVQQTGLTVGVKSLAVSSLGQIGATDTSLPFRVFRPDSGQMRGDEDDPAMECGL